jgi:hypothetical protein
MAPAGDGDDEGGPGTVTALALCEVAQKDCGFPTVVPTRQCLGMTELCDYLGSTGNVAVLSNSSL